VVLRHERSEGRRTLPYQPTNNFIFLSLVQPLISASRFKADSLDESFSL